MKNVNDMTRDELLDYTNQMRNILNNANEIFTNLGYSNCVDEFVGRKPKQMDVKIGLTETYAYSEVRHMICQQYKRSQTNFIIRLIICDIKNQLGLKRDGNFEKLDHLILTICDSVKEHIDAIINEDPTQSTILAKYDLIIAPIVQQQVHEFTVNLMMETFGPQK